MTTPAAVRAQLVRALKADLVGPYAPPGLGPDAEGELLSLPPSRWYLAGFLAPEQGRTIEDDPTEDDQLGAGNDEDREDGAGQEPEPKQRHHLPASMGLSVLLPAKGVEAVEAVVSWADYLAEPEARSADESSSEGATISARRGRPKLVWRRHPRPTVTLKVPLDPIALGRGLPVPDSAGVVVVGQVQPADAPGLPQGTRALALFVVNRRAPVERPRADEAFLFQVELEIRSPVGFVPRPSRRGEDGADWDERVADLQFRHHVEVAVGHGVSVDVPEGQNPIRQLRTTWLPTSEARRVVTRETPGVMTSMEDLAELADGAAASRALTPIVAAYGEWLAAQRKVELDSDRRRQTRDQLLEEAQHARERIAAGIALLGQEPDVLEAFRLANRAMAMAARARNPERYTDGKRPSWRLFQLAFVLLNLRGLAQGDQPGASEDARIDRETVELIFFPTGGGKTEAYLGVIAFVLLLRRLRGRGRPDRGLGVAVLLRYTLRLLTLDQLGRAASLVCALEKIRAARKEALGDVRFAVGLWVGKTATANTLAAVAKQITEYRNNPSPNAPSPFPLTTCPWCQWRLKPESLSLTPNRTKPEAVTVGCTHYECDFSAAKNPEGLPVVFVDEQVYRELPAFLVATVDKFAMLPWRGETGMLFGRVSSRRDRRFFGPLDGRPRDVTPLPQGLRPPELIVQDELHLISGPLGTLVGLYETAIAALCEHGAGGAARTLPKLMAATATVRRARPQIQAIFGRREVALFPPPGPDDSETFFAGADRDSAGRLYVGVAAAGRAMKAILLRTYIALVTSAERGFDRGRPRSGPDDPPQAQDPYLTLVGYFNSLRELGGMRRLVEDEVRTRAAQAEGRLPLDARGAPHRWARNRTIAHEPVELTSRESTAKVAQTRNRLGVPHPEKESIDVLLASNMISVGVDIDRLGLMVVAGQPKTTAEYIQATSRVGRDAARPGLVVTCFNVMKPRDRSHYERFTAYHGAFYRFVESASVTPFSGPALDRGFAGTLLAIARLHDPRLTPPTNAMLIEEHRALAQHAAQLVAARGGDQPGLEGPEQEAVVAALARRGKSLLDAWTRLVVETRDAAGQRCYSPYDKDREGKPMLYTVTDEAQPPRGSNESRFAAPTSMRDVEATVHVWVEERNLGGRRG